MPDQELLQASADLRKDDADGRRVLMSVTEPGVKLLTDRRSQTTRLMAAALAGKSRPSR